VGGRQRAVALEVGRFALAGAVVLVLVGMATAVAARRVGVREGIASARITTVTKAQGLVAATLSDSILRSRPAAVARVDRVVRSRVLDRNLVRVKLWRRDGTIVYSDERRLVGRRFALGEDEQEAMASGRIAAQVTDLDRPENRYERQHGKLLEVYLPIETPGGTPLLFEAYYRYTLVSDKGAELWRSFAPIALGALLVLELVQIPLAYSLARRLRQRSAQREALLERALHASDVERREIAGDLHDGVVQDLAGVAYALAADARRGGEAAAGSEQAAETVRASVRALRSLIVDIYPPDLDEGSLESALTDLLARAGEEGLETSLDTTRLATPVTGANARLLYRAAQEGLRNVVRHAGATAVSVTVTSDGDSATITIADDGVGVDPAHLDERRRAGHVGLTTLRGLLHDAGGTVSVSSGAGGGTVMRAELPR
jgi:two-component system NarL family sensor kinase